MGGELREAVEHVGEPCDVYGAATAGSCTVTATSKADGTKSAKATVTVSAPVAITVAPTTASLATGGKTGLYGDGDQHDE